MNPSNNPNIPNGNQVDGSIYNQLPLNNTAIVPESPPKIAQQNPTQVTENPYMQTQTTIQAAYNPYGQTQPQQVVENPYMQTQTATQATHNPYGQTQPQQVVENPYMQTQTATQTSYNPYSQMQSQQIAGSPYNTTPQTSSPAPSPQGGVTQPQGITRQRDDDEVLLECFIGSNYKDIIKSPFNIGGLLGIAYLFYRKMFLIGLGIAILYAILVLLLPINSFIIYVIMIVIIALSVNKIYVARAKQKINKIKLKNSGKSLEELKMICASKGGTSIGLAIGGVILTAFVLLIVIMGTMFSILMYSFFNFLPSGIKIMNDSNYELIEKEDPNSNTKSVLNVVPPENFVPVETEDNDFEFIYNLDSGGSVPCYYTVTSYTQTPATPEEILDSYRNNTIKYNVSNTNKVNYNNIDWYYIQTEISNQNIYYYLMELDDNIYRVKYSVEKENAPVGCKNNIANVVKGITKK